MFRNFRIVLDNNQKAFLALVRAGLWGDLKFKVLARASDQGRAEGLKFKDFQGVDWGEVYRMAEEQGVVGLIADAIERITINGARLTVPQVLNLQFVGATLQIEQRNKAMNGFVAELTERMREAEISALLVKGQGVAQCYEKPLWRPSGDVDLLLDKENYERAKALLLPLSSSSKKEERYSQHLGMSIGQWYVEIHGSLRTGLSANVDREVDKVVRDSLSMVNGRFGAGARVWENGATDIYLPEPTNNVFLVFTHFIKHFYKEGMSLRQVCDWCRLMWTYRSELDYGKLESWIRKAGLMEEWKTFYILATKYLGLPDVVNGSWPSQAAKPSARLMVLAGASDQGRANDSRFEKKAERLMAFILGGYSGNKVKDTWQIGKIFPWKALRYSPSIFLNVNWLKAKERLVKG